MNILITGANGFIGKNVMAYLEQLESIKVMQFVLFSPMQAAKITHWEDRK